MQTPSILSRRPIFLGALLLSCGTLLGRAMTRQDAEAPEKAQEQAQERPGAPGEVHAAMMQFAGSYTTKTTFQPTPDAEGMVSQGTAEMVASLGGRFLVENNKGSFMGAPVEGINIWGYNSGSEEFESCWTWTNSTGILSMRGTPNNETGITEWSADYRDESGEDKEMRLTSTVTEAGTFIVQMFAPVPDSEDEYPLMVIEYQRKP